MKPTIPYQQRFWKYVNKLGSLPLHVDGLSNCWEWTAHVEKIGYGVFSAEGRAQKAHRVSWKIHVGEIPPGLFVLHKCDNRKCVRPDHLFVGSQKENMQDAKAKKRTNCPRGSKHLFARFTEDQITEIRKSELNQTDLAKKYNVWQGTISSIISKKTWKHVG